MICGHDTVRRHLEEQLPAVTLLRGPESVGKRTLSEHLAHHHGYLEVDTKRHLQLTVDDSRELRRFCSTTPMGKAGKLGIVRLGGATDAALNSLLKLLEEPPPYARFILSSVDSPLDTIASRAQVFRLGLLTPEQLLLVLTARLGMEPKMAERASVLGRGQVSRALLVGEQDAGRAYVLGALKAVSDQDGELLAAALNKWDDAAHELLATWCREAITGRWQTFTTAETFGLAGTDIPYTILEKLRLAARPRLAARVALEACLVR